MYVDDFLQVAVSCVNPPLDENVNNSSAEVFLTNSQERSCDQNLNPPVQYSQEYASSQDSVVSVVTNYTESPQLGYGWYPYDGSQSGSLTQDSSGSSLVYSDPLTQEKPYAYYNSDQDDTMTVCDSVCSFSTVCSDATTIQDFSQDLSQSVMDLENFEESDIGMREYFDQAYYSNINPTVSQQNVNMLDYANQMNFQNQSNISDLSYPICQPGMGMQMSETNTDQGDIVSAQNTAPYDENIGGVSAVSESSKQTNGQRENLYPKNVVNSTDTTSELFAANQINGQQADIYSNYEISSSNNIYKAQRNISLPVIDQTVFEAAPKPPTPALHLSDAGILSVLLRNNIAVEMTLDRAIRLVDHKQNMVAAATSRGDMSCLYHAAAKISNQQGICEADLFWDRRAKLCPEGIIFSCGPACYILQSRRLVAIPPDFADLSSDLSVTMLFSSSTYGPHIIPHLEEVIRQATYKYHDDGLGVTILINGVRVEQRRSGDVFVEHGSTYLHLSSARQFLHVDTPMSELSVEKEWLVKVKYRGFNMICGTKGMTLSDGVYDCGFNPYRRSFLRPAYFNVQTIILDGVSIKSDYKRRWLNRKRNNQLSARRPFYRRPEPDYSGRVQGLDQIIRREGEADSEYYARLKSYRDKTDRGTQDDCKVTESSAEKHEQVTKDKKIKKEICEEAMKCDMSSNDIGAAGDNIAHVWIHWRTEWEKIEKKNLKNTLVQWVLIFLMCEFPGEKIAKEFKKKKKQKKKKQKKKERKKKEKKERD